MQFEQVAYYVYFAHYAHLHVVMNQEFHCLVNSDDKKAYQIEFQVLHIKKEPQRNGIFRGFLVRALEIASIQVRCCIMGKMKSELFRALYNQSMYDVLSVCRQ